MSGKLKIIFAILILSIVSGILSSSYAQDQKSTSAVKKTTGTQSPPTKPVPKPTPKPAAGSASGQSSPAQVKKANPLAAAPPAQAQKPELIVPELINQGKSLYQGARFKQALARFESALKQDANNDEALGLAAVTAYRLDNQAQSREYLLRRSELPSQKDSVKAYCFYRISLTYWREAHDIVAKYGGIVDGKLAFKLPEKAESDADQKIATGLDFVERALAISNNSAEAYNIKNLLHAEAALAESDEAKAQEHFDKSIQALRRSIDLAELSATNRAGDTVDFSQPTVRIAEFAVNKADDEKLVGRIDSMIDGAKPIKRVQAVFPSVRPPKAAPDPNDPAASGVTSSGGAYSLGSGRGALTAAYLAGIVKVEVLISTSGDVVFAHNVDGRSDLSGAAILAARGWKFEPARFEGRPVQVSGVISFSMKPR